MRFEAYDWRGMRENVFSLVADGWMLITAGEAGAWNTMTASWGGFGHLWNTDVAFVFVRPSRHTWGFMEKRDGFSLSFFAPEHKKALAICGAVSGRDTDKAAAAGLSPRAFGSASGSWTGFEEARIVFGCRKLHAQDIDPSDFVDPGIEGHYPEHDYHRMYVGAIEAAWLGAPE